MAGQTIRRRRQLRHKARRARAQNKTAQTKPSIARNIAGLAAKVFAISFALIFGLTLGFLAAIALLGL